MRYIRSPGAPNGSATKRSAVSAGAAEVAARELRAGEVQLAGVPAGDRPQAGVEDPQAGVGDRPADRHALAVAGADARRQVTWIAASVGP